MARLRQSLNLSRYKKLERATEKIYNFAMGIQGNTEQGSTFKITFHVALLGRKIISLNDKVEDREWFGPHVLYRAMRIAKMVAIAPSPFGKLLKVFPCSHL